MQERRQARMQVSIKAIEVTSILLEIMEAKQKASRTDGSKKASKTSKQISIIIVSKEAIEKAGRSQESE